MSYIFIECQMWADLCEVLLLPTTASLWYLVTSRGPFHKRFFHRNSHWTKMLFYSLPGCSDVIAMKLCIYHDSCTVVTCAKFPSDDIPYSGVKLKQIFNRIWITMAKSILKCPPPPPPPPIPHDVSGYIYITVHECVRECINMRAIGATVT